MDGSHLMASRRKTHLKTDLTTPKVDRSLGDDGRAVIAPEAIPPAVTMVHFGHNALNDRNFDFARYYGAGIDEITYVC